MVARILLAVMAVASLAGASAADAPAEDLDALFTRIDANRDGFIDRHEAWADARVERRFALGDINHDGWLDRAELQALVRSQ